MVELRLICFAFLSAAALLGPAASASARQLTKTAPPARDWLVEAEAFGGVLGPVTYDRTPATQSPSRSTDRPITSTGGALRFVRSESLISGYVRLLWRVFQDTENVVETKQENGARVGQATQTLSARGPGLGAGLERGAAPGRWFLPYVGCAYERSQLRMQGEVPSDGGRTTESVNESSVLHVAYVEAGTGFRLWSGRASMVTLRAGLVAPFYQNGTNAGAATEGGKADSAVTALRRLDHRATPGATLGLAVGFFP